MISLCLESTEKEEKAQEFYAQLAGHEEYTNCISAKGYPTSPNKCPGYETKQSDGEASAMLELWGMQSTFSLQLRSGPLWPEVVAPDRVLSMGQIELFVI